MKDGDDRAVSARLTPQQEALIRGFRYYHFRSAIVYSQTRPTQLRLPRETTRLDCSGLVAAIMDFAGVFPDVDWRYTNTDTQIRLGRPVTVSKPGDVVFYGKGSDPSHEALMLGTRSQLAKLVTIPPEVREQMTVGATRYVLSMGHYPMGIFPVDYRPDRIAIRRFL